MFIPLIDNYAHIIYLPRRCPSQPTVNDCTDGDYTYKRGFLVWNVSVISADKSATIDFDLATANNDDFFPISCTFNSAQNLAGLIVSVCAFFTFLLFFCLSLCTFSPLASFTPLPSGTF